MRMFTGQRNCSFAFGCSVGVLRGGAFVHCGLGQPVPGEYCCLLPPPLQQTDAQGISVGHSRPNPTLPFSALFSPPTLSASLHYTALRCLQPTLFSSPLCLGHFPLFIRLFGLAMAQVALRDSCVPKPDSNAR